MVATDLEPDEAQRKQAIGEVLFAVLSQCYLLPF